MGISSSAFWLDRPVFVTGASGLAAQTIVTIANRNPLSTFETNIAGIWSLLEACRRSPKVSQVVVASSDKA